MGNGFIGLGAAGLVLLMSVRDGSLTGARVGSGRWAAGGLLKGAIGRLSVGSDTMVAALNTSVHIQVCACGCAHASVHIQVCACRCAHAGVHMQVCTCRCAHAGIQVHV